MEVPEVAPMVMAHHQMIMMEADPVLGEVVESIQVVAQVVTIEEEVATMM